MKFVLVEPRDGVLGDGWVWGWLIGDGGRDRCVHVWKLLSMLLALAASSKVGCSAGLVRRSGVGALSLLGDLERCLGPTNTS